MESYLITLGIVIVLIVGLGAYSCCVIAGESDKRDEKDETLLRNENSISCDLSRLESISVERCLDSINNMKQ